MEDIILEYIKESPFWVTINGSKEIFHIDSKEIQDFVSEGYEIQEFQP